MDPHVSDPLLQKTFANSESSSCLPAHHRGLSPSIYASSTSSSTATPHFTHRGDWANTPALCNIAALPSQTPPPAALSQSTSPSMTSPRLSFPEQYDGTPNKCKGFLLQCTIHGPQPHLYPTDDSRVPFVCSLLTGRALDWATAMWEGGNMAFPSFRNFMQQFQEVFDHAVDGKEVGEQLLA